jgi:hypothetical protein
MTGRVTHSLALNPLTQTYSISQDTPTQSLAPLAFGRITHVSPSGSLLSVEGIPQTLRHRLPLIIPSRRTLY